ncbi:hypothetical protein PDE_09204 [Penicillium oxalicum 114-2]|uniref:F-box domain-containing protein n=1 Tax=Penicillium oxalicum (strain 114-2 / CGMCC 5302) TaxID=933388 RepID=S7ZU59_PENO1|nr:hypothetical protein PDE_09204 [Penicillium oxalicum 114-2]
MHLTELPPELMLMIMRSLSPSDKASLALSCWKMMDAVTREGVRKIDEILGEHKQGDTESERCLFLRKIVEDIPDHYLCYNCGRLHLWEAVPHPGDYPFENELCPTFQIPPIFSKMAVWDCSDAHYHLDFAHIHLATRRQIRGPEYGIHPEMLSYVEVKPEYLSAVTTLPEPEMFFQKHTVRVTTIDARVSPEPVSFYLRAQSMRVGHETLLKDRVIKDPAASWRDFIRQNECAHLRCRPRPHWEPTLSEVIASFSQYVQPPVSPGRKLVTPCRDCRTLFKYETRRFEGGYLVLIVTRYVDLGPGKVPQRPSPESDGEPGADVPTVSDESDEAVVGNLQLQFDSCPDDGRTQRIISEEEVISRSFKVAVEQTYDKEMTRLDLKGWTFFQKPDRSANSGVYSP